MDEVTLLSPDGLVQSPAYSHVAVVPPGATTLYVGGQNGVDAHGDLVSEDFTAQTAQALANLRTALAAGGATLDDLVSWSILVVDGVDVAAGARVAAGVLNPERRPPLITLARVAGLGVPGALVEVSGIAAVRR
ncbi:RidA family protein [Cellulomonas triticagri]|uniref:RidA family protein n=1 Tax=Cellulomonas triticagri TaxID=2483352 RepID=A0A3M2JMV0_9CELL|nr:RidA family protein [Cellulomonas triticagri]RMI13621.1 RidA family protein [Cellulomonas triticagri]